MHPIAAPRTVTAPNALGHDSTTIHHRHVVQKSDVGQTRPHYLGFRHRDYTFRREDVGREVNIMTDGRGWTCWYFLEK